MIPINSDVGKLADEQDLGSYASGPRGNGAGFPSGVGELMKTVPIGLLPPAIKRWRQTLQHLLRSLDRCRLVPQSRGVRLLVPIPQTGR
jgi:hypothetical protein